MLPSCAKKNHHGSRILAAKGCSTQRRALNPKTAVQATSMIASAKRLARIELFHQRSQRMTGNCHFLQNNPGGDWKICRNHMNCELKSAGLHPCLPRLRVEVRRTSSLPTPMYSGDPGVWPNAFSKLNFMANQVKI